jgi:hypothetical protein
VEVLAAAGHEVTEKRARELLRRIAATGRLVKTDPVRAVYDTVEQ